MSFSVFDPHCFTPVYWGFLENGDEVYIKGTNNGQFRAYGPHIVISVQDRCLESVNLNVKFLHYPEELLRVKF